MIFLHVHGEIPYGIEIVEVPFQNIHFVKQTRKTAYKYNKKHVTIKNNVKN